MAWLFSVALFCSIVSVLVVTGLFNLLKHSCTIKIHYASLHKVIYCTGKRLISIVAERPYWLAWLLSVRREAA